VQKILTERQGSETPPRHARGNYERREIDVSDERQAGVLELPEMTFDESVNQVSQK
jgi:hypothetical protein